MSYIQGQYVKKFESGSRGCKVIAQCGNDWGASFGTFQLTLRWGNVIWFLQKKFPRTSKPFNLYFNKNKKDFESTEYPGTTYCSTIEQVKKCWFACIEAVGVTKFEATERAYIKSMYYDVTNGHFKKNLKVDISTLSIAWQEAVWSCSVRDGSKSAYNFFRDSVGQAKFTEMTFDQYYDFRKAKHNDSGRWTRGNNSGEREQIRIFLDDYVPTFTSITNDSPVPHIMWLQFKLGKLDIDGKWGPKTAARVHDFFRTQGWTVNSGYGVGKTTIKTLLKA